MPVLDWLGKEKVINHHLDVPFRFLDKKFSVGASENKIIHGDNLLALKSLLPEFAGRVKCIYIDPPYNTGNENWIYNDAVNDPQIRRWLGQVVGKEGEDLTRHDKWLCMMYPRLRLLQKLLSEDGAIFISIDDNEQANLKLICDEIFGANNFVAQVICRTSDNSNNDSKKFSLDHNSLLVYSKNVLWQPNKLLDADKQSHFKNPDNNPRGAYFDGNPLNSPNPRPNLRYEIESPTGFKIQPPTNGWRWSKETLAEKLSSGEIFFTADGKGIRRRTYLADMAGLPPSSLWVELEKTGSTRKAKNELKKIFPENKTADLFRTPKPTALIEYILRLATDKNSIVLDSFAGSGTTAHAVINLNAQDGGNRKFILIELNDYAESITAERVKRVGGEFNFYELGATLFDDDGFINAEVSREKIFDYVYFAETHKHYQPTDEENLLGVDDGIAYYFFDDEELNFDLLAKIRTRAAAYVIYAENCTLAETELDEFKITFKKIPRDILRL